MGWPWSSSAPSTPPQTQPDPSPPPPPSSTPSPPPPPAYPTQTKDDSDFHAAFPHLAPAAPQPPSDPSSDAPSQYPSTMSCRTAFDSAFYCSSFGGHFHDIYRYGQLRSCSEHWSDFWFCMRTKQYGAEQKRQMVEERYREKEERVLRGKNSEDVWERRREGEEVRGAFSKVDEV
ncbi:hypothetical protein EJ04DRAFT_531494 [Polyplosphaeria fusca]|uniref:Early meiotic induction protein 1 n=1 Tax=Polyplosphaeria fusca TaxID=682080 RepID=A0A9P4R5P2_9PLEO|nr:hypothetical protein EJ04DRAFT_531494 [Polyplosphaeria fusca]